MKYVLHRTNNLKFFRLHGSYKALDGGHLADALVDFTGGVSEIVDLKRDDVSEHAERSASLFHDLQKEISDHSLICCIHAVSDGHLGFDGLCLLICSNIYCWLYNYRLGFENSKIC